MSDTRSDAVRQNVRERYAEIARGERTGCGPSEGTSCCGGTAPSSLSLTMGYKEEDLGKLPEGTDLGLGCGSPTALAELKPGEAVLDLGCGAGIDCFLAAAQVGAGGHVIGVDMTPEMLARARSAAVEQGARQVEFRLGEIENLPAADSSVDVVISNCVVNLSPDKARVFRESFRVLKPGGRVAISDIVAVGEIPAGMRNDPEAYAGCVSGAVPPAEVERMLRDAGFTDVSVEPAELGVPGVALDFVRSAAVRGRKPAAPR